MSRRSTFVFATIAIIGASSLMASDASAAGNGIIWQRNPGVAAQAPSVSSEISSRYGRLTQGCSLPDPSRNHPWVQPEIAAIRCR
jgi:hypothetical protein